MTTNPMISVIVPVIDEAYTVEDLFIRTKKIMQSMDKPFEFIFIDDGSTDDTIDILKKLIKDHPELTIIRHQKKHGKSIALMQGFDEARSEIAIIMDGDLQDQPEEIPKFIEKMEEGDDLVNGWRIKRKDSLIKRLLSKMFNIIASTLFKSKLHDINCGFKAIRRNVFSRLDLRGDLHRLIPIVATSYGFKVSEIPIDHFKRAFGKSKYKLFRFRGLLDIIAFLVMSATQIRPFYIFLKLSFFSWLLALTCLFTWSLLYVFIQSPSVSIKLISTLVSLIGIFSTLIALILPLFGLNLELIAKYHQDSSWRKKLVKEIIRLKE